MRSLLVSLALGPATLASTFAQDFSYEVIALSKSGETVLATGRIPIADAAISHEPQSPGSTVLHRQLLLPEGWAVGCTDYGEKAPNGFGCWLRKSSSSISKPKYDGFSWEWYDQRMGTLYEKRQGRTAISLSLLQANGLTSMRSLTFLADTTFQVNMNERAEPGTYTHELRIRKGSVLPLSKVPPGQ
ncbi:MAG: hypothetical protein KA439_08035 [Rhizobacter sp.]|nr:hypothetical protein [Rhizobacter sp.]MBP6269650.1 hypothetical protein [Rhizobacter sp.]